MHGPKQPLTVPVTAKAAGGLIVPADADRKKLILGAPGTNRITFAWSTPGVVLDVGVTLYPGQQPMVFSSDDG